jgi:hypothetical protein
MRKSDRNRTGLEKKIMGVQNEGEKIRQENDGCAEEC